MSRILRAVLMSIGLVGGSGMLAQAAQSQPAGEWILTWGAFAQSPVTGEVGTTVGKLSEAEAREEALEQCGKKGAPQCKVALVFHNQCAAVAAGKTGTSFQTAGSEERASTLAKKSCEEDGASCKVMYSECTKAVFKRD